MLRRKVSIFVKFGLFQLWYPSAHSPRPLPLTPGKFMWTSTVIEKSKISTLSSINVNCPRQIGKHVKLIVNTSFS